MQRNNLDQYFTPVSSGKKRPRSNSSPSCAQKSNMADDKVGEMSLGQLMASLSNMMDQKLANLATKVDLDKLNTRLEVLENKNKELGEKLELMKSENTYIKNRLVDMEARDRRNNLVFKGLNRNDGNRDYRETVKRFCCDMFGASNDLWVNRAHPLGKNGLVIAHLPADTDIEYIMERTSRLKGTGYAVFRDYPTVIREKRWRLMAVRREVERLAGRRRMPLVFDHLTIEGCRLTWEDGMLMAGKQDGAQRLREIIHHDLTAFLDGLAGGKGDRKPREGHSPTTGLPDAEASIPGVAGGGQRSYSAAVEGATC